MTNRKLAAGVVGLCVVVGTSGVAVAATTFPSKATVKVSQVNKVVPNRYFQDGLRWAKDVYRVKSGGTITVFGNVITEGPHTFTIVKKSDLPKTAKAIEKCAICQKLGQAHGADPNSDAPPKFQFLENGVGQNTPPNLDRPGDSGLTGPGQSKTEHITFKVTAKKGSTLYFMCIIHPWMQGKVQVG